MISRKILELKRKIEDLQYDIAEEQKKCPHENVRISSRSHDDIIYWVEVDCLDCELRRRFDSVRDKTLYHEYVNRK